MCMNRITQSPRAVSISDEAPLIGSSLVFATLVALLMNLLFRIGTRRRARLMIERDRIDSEEIEKFITAQGALWGARRDVIDRASFNLVQSIETLTMSDVAQGPLEVEASFDEFNVELRVTYDGPPLELPQTRPSNEEILASEHGERRLAGFMLRRFADRVSVRERNGRSTVLFHFDH